MIKQRPTISEWLDLPTEQRGILVLRFMINKSGGVQVRNNMIVSDGVSDDDLENGVNIGKMIDFLGEQDWKKYINVPLEDLSDTLWAACVAKEFNLPAPFEVKEPEVNALSQSPMQTLQMDAPLAEITTASTKKGHSKVEV